MFTPEILSAFAKADHIAIFGHDNPDGDAIGSMLGLWRLLEKQGKRVSYFASPAVSESFLFVPDIAKVKDTFDYSKRYDLIVFVDFSPYDRTVFSAGKYDYFDTKQLVVIDHHIGPTPAHALVCKDERADSNCEWIFENTKNIWSDYYDSTVATYLYMGLATDTGNFLYDKQGARSLANASQLVALWADKHQITTRFFNTLQFEQLLFVQQVLPALIRRDNFAYIAISPEQYESLWLDKEKAAGFLLFLLSKIQGVDLMIMGTVQEDMIKLSFRSKSPDYSAQKLAAALGGGGHFYAAGAKVSLENLDPQAFGEQLLDRLPTLLAS